MQRVSSLLTPFGSFPAYSETSLHNIELTLEAHTHCKVDSDEEGKGVLFKYSSVYSEIQKRNAAQETKSGRKTGRFS